MKIQWATDKLKIIYAGLRPFLIPILLIVISLILFKVFLFPSMQVILNAKVLRSNTIGEAQTLKTNLDILSNLDDKTLDSDLSILTAALPYDSDFQEISGSLAAVSLKAGVALAPYQSSLGNLSGNTQSGKYPALEISLTLNGDMNAVSNFIQILEKTVPLSDVQSLSMTNTTSSVKVLFFFKASAVNRNSTDTVKLIPISAKDTAIINQMKTH